MVRYLGDLGADFVVFKNDEKTVEEIRAMNPAGVLVSPGPGRPVDSGISLQAVKELGPDFPLFGVCMGHQCIGEAFGGDVVRAPTGVMHGKTSPVFHTNAGILEGLENPFEAGRYHSLVIDKAKCPDDLEVTAWTEDGTIMGVRHKRYPHIQGVQFHPESIITAGGKRIVENWVKITRGELAPTI
ncbi:anthranilate synthase component II [Monoraphidium neglectum]|uniref:Anthranilate synthase component 2 n=1 Tax=Monoraphidium neglectum TaxID=145388 RepID=A0A0D2MZG9_9CHLO|nr:anthranilate synthase component II [Monoraphidium neglectum]KIZ07815.1 anthranilate synthase component II [Monoraphidium neglectum]|eukprot:XP_013906834.1 anthranilate synthase component II [Monoraphidium neglectum]